MPNGNYSWLTLTDAVSQLGQRLNIVPSTTTLWTIDELTTYIIRSLQMYNSLVWQWRTDFQFYSTSVWNNLGLLAGSPRLRTLTDNDIYAELEFLLLEPSNTTGTWTGTNQFQLSDLSQALQRRRDEMLQVSNANLQLLTGIPTLPNTIRTLLPDSVIDVPRVRYMALTTSPIGTAASGDTSIAVSSTVGISVGQFVSGANINYWTTVTAIGIGSVSISIPTTGAISGIINFFTPNTLYRDDTVAQEFYEPPLYELPAGTPQTFSLSSEPPLSWDVDIPPGQAGVYEAITLQSGAPFNPPTPTLLNIPDDFAWVLEFGALADLLGRQEEATDRERSVYCMKRYQDGLQLMLKTPWIELGKVNGAAVSLDSLYSLDRYDCNWDSDPQNFGPVIVTAGTDFIGVPVNAGIGVTVLGNAPILDSTGTWVQVSRSDWDTVLDLAQSRSLFKISGAEWKSGLELERRALLACAAENVRLRSLGAFSDVIDQRGLQQERDMQRYNKEHAV